MDRKLFSLERRIEKLGSENKLNTKHTLIMKIPYFMWLLHYQIVKEINTQPKIQQHNNNGAYARKREDIKTGIADGEETDFQVKIEFVGPEGDWFEIYYMAYDTMLVKPSCSLQSVDKSGYLISTLVLDNIAPEQSCLVDKNEWQFLGVQYKERLSDRTDCLQLTFEFLVAQKTENTVPKVEDKKFDVPTVPEVNVVLLMNEAYSDVTVRSAEGEEFPAHKAFLGTSSPVLNAHFAHDMLENKTNIVESPLEAAVLKELLTYIYTNAAPNIDQFPRKLLEAADYYQINGLKTLCESAIAKKLSVENAIETLEFANKYRSDYLKRKTLEFIKNGAAADICETDGWKALASVDIIKSVYECIARNKTE